MTYLNFIFLSVLFFCSCQFALAQPNKSHLSISISVDKVQVDGVVSSAQIDEQIRKKLSNRFQGPIDFSGLRVDSSVSAFPLNWEVRFDDLIRELSIPKIKTSVARKPIRVEFTGGLQSESDYPPLPPEIREAKILFDDGERSISDLSNGIVVFTFMEYWAGPVRAQLPVLNQMYTKFAGRGLSIVGISTEAEEKETFRKFTADAEIKFRTGWTDKAVFDSFTKVSRFIGIPQSFVVVDGHLRGIFTGSSTSTDKKLEEFVSKIVEERLEKY